MMNFFQSFKHPDMPSAEKLAIHSLFYKQNTDKIKIAILLALPVSVIHIFLFYFKLNSSFETEYIWRFGIILAHTFISFSLIIIYLFILYFFSKNRNNYIFNRNLSHFGFFFILSAGVVIASIDQMVTNAIHPYLLVCIFIPLIINLPIKYSILYYLLSLFEFVFIIPIFQHDKNILLSNYVNGISASGFGIILAYTLWRMNTTRLVQSKLIEKQTQILEDQNNKLLVLSEDLKTINESKDKFFSILAHDLRSPINGFLGLSGILADDLTAFTESQIKEMALAMKTSATNIFNLLNNLLEWSLVQRGFIAYKPEEINLTNLIAEVINSSKTEIDSKGLNIINLIDKEYSFTADSHMISIVVRNLIMNAIKFTKSGGQITIWIHEKAENWLSFSIQDNGIGMSPEISSSLFKIAESINRKGTLGEPTTGLGLVICKEFIDKHKGTINVESTEGVGTIFTVNIPVSATKVPLTNANSYSAK